jgi:hypothetical protein
MHVTHSLQNSATYNKRMPGGLQILQNMIGHVIIKSVIYTVQFGQFSNLNLQSKQTTK